MWTRIALIFFFVFSCLIGPMPVRAELALPTPGKRMELSLPFNPPILKGLKVHPDQPFKFDFILDQGDNVISATAGIQQQEQLKTESARLIKYFLASLTIPEKDLWVNLSPYEKNRIIPESFGQTEMGRDLLAEDYMLKQITASLIYPEGDIGKKFWQRIYAEAVKQFGTTDIPVNTFNKVWIVPEKAVVYENIKAGAAYVVESRLKVMLEQDYMALSHAVIPANPPHAGGSQRSAGIQDASAIGSQIVREIVIPELTKEVNEGQNFAQLRQVYNSLILATWYKKKIKDSILAKVYTNKNKVAGVRYNSSVIPANAGIQSMDDTEAIYHRYLQAFKKGVYNYIKEEQDPMTKETTPRKYFSGGMNIDPAPAMIAVNSSQLPDHLDHAMHVDIDLALTPQDNSFYAASPAMGYMPDESYRKNLLRQARANYEGMENNEKRLLWRSSVEQANIIITTIPDLGAVGKKEITIHQDTILAYTFLAWLAQSGHLLPLEQAQALFYKTYDSFEKQTMDYLSDLYRDLYHEWPQQHQFKQIKWPRNKKIGQAADKLFQIEAASSLLHLHRFEYEMPAPAIDPKEVLKTGRGIINVGIYNQLLKDNFALARHGGADPRANFIVILWNSGLRFEEINGRVRALATSGVVFKNDKPYFVRLEKPIILDYVANFDSQLNERFAKAGIPIAGHPLADEYLEEKDITNRILRSSGIHVPKTFLFWAHRSKYVFINDRRSNADDVVKVNPREVNFKWRIEKSLRDFLRNNHIKQGVIKPNRGAYGDGVMFFNEQTIDQAVKHVISLIGSGQNVLVQQRIIPWLVKGLEGQRLDWNERGFVSRDENGHAKTSDVVVRIGYFDQAINGSKGASDLTLEEVGEKLSDAVDVATWKRVQEDALREPARAYEAIHQAMLEDGFDASTDFMGTDGIVSRDDGETYFMELNGYNSGEGGYLDEHIQQTEPDRVGRWAKYWIETSIQRGRKYRTEDANFSSKAMTSQVGDHTVVVKRREYTTPKGNWRTTYTIILDQVTVKELGVEGKGNDQSQQILDQYRIHLEDSVNGNGVSHEVNGHAGTKHTGGIDLTADKLNVQTKVDSHVQGNETEERNDRGIQFNIDPAMLQQLQYAPGFEINHMTITPLGNLKEFLGVENSSISQGAML